MNNPGEIRMDNGGSSEDEAPECCKYNNISQYVCRQCNIVILSYCVDNL